METTLKNKFLSFDTAKVQTLTLEQLERTQLEKDVYGNPLRGIYHFALINEIIKLCNEAQYNVEVYDLFAAQNKERQTPGVVIIPEIEARYGERAVEAHLLRRVFANIRLTDFDDEENTTNLAVAFHQKGIQVGFGNMVKICHNQCLLAPTQYIATYDERAKQIPKECDPQEVYFYEWNNHETMYSWDGDYEAIKIILEYFGMEAAMSITRIDACDLNKLIERDHPYIFRPQSEPTV